MAAMDSRLIDFTPTDSTAPSPSPSPSPSSPHNAMQNSPQRGPSPTQTGLEARTRRQERHSKKLSLSFPILIPSRGTETPNSHSTASPVALSANPSSHGPLYPSPSTYALDSSGLPSRNLPMPLTPPSERSEDDPLQSVDRTDGKLKTVNVSGHSRQGSNSSDFLTLLASQERRVLELKEELSRAETELSALKKQWAVYEAGKKKDEAKGIPQKMGPVTSSHTRAISVIERGTGLGLLGLHDTLNEDGAELEREKKRELARERMMGRWTSLENGQASNTNNNRKTGQRVFSSSKHTRALSLLTTNVNTRPERTGSLDSFGDKHSLGSSRQASTNASATPVTNASPSAPTLSRSNSGLDSLNFGKTYKDLANAASRKNLPPGLSPEQIVKHSKLVVDGVRDGLWTFFEDIRQATVGDEAINGSTNGVSRQNSTRQPSGAANSKLKRSTSERKSNTSHAKKSTADDKDSSFWKEFGMDTPKSDKVKKEPEKRPALPGRWPSTKTGTDFADHCCPKHGHGEVSESTTTTTTTTTDAPPPPTQSPTKKKIDGPEHHESKSSTDSRNPPSLLADLLDDEDEGWDQWESNTEQDPSSPEFKKGGTRRVKRFSGQSVRDVQWHDLMS